MGCPPSPRNGGFPDTPSGPGLGLIVGYPGGMSNAFKFLVIDADDDSRILLERALLRRFPNCALLECASLGAAFELVRNGPPTAILVHRADGMDGASAVRELRKVFPTLPIVMVSVYDHSRDALAAGATRFLLREDWARTGFLFEELLKSDELRGVADAQHAATT